MVITRKTPETKVLIEWWWHAERYTKNELLRAFEEAGFRNPAFLKFPLRYTWLNRASYGVEARSAISRDNIVREADPLLREKGSQCC